MGFFKVNVNLSNNVSVNIELHDVKNRTPNAYRVPMTSGGIIVIDIYDSESEKMLSECIYEFESHCGDRTVNVKVPLTIVAINSNPKEKPYLL